MSRITAFVERTWYESHAGLSLVVWLLLPLTALFYCVSTIRRWAFRKRWLKAQRIALPVIVVGNISVGGTGKTPMVAYLVTLLRNRGYHPAIISRGYGGSNTRIPARVDAHSDPLQVGDEAVLLAARCRCPVVVSRDRVAAANVLVQSHDCDVIISDDGLQHYRLERDVEIVMLDGERGLGNGLLLPAGPLRESASRLRQASLVVSTGVSQWAQYNQQLRLQSAINLKNNNIIKSLEDFCGAAVVAIAGIGNPQRFFSALAQRGLTISGVAFADHQHYHAEDFTPFSQQTILMTEKDAVKCAAFATTNMWYVPVESELNNGFDDQFLGLIEPLIKQHH